MSNVKIMDVGMKLLFFLFFFFLLFKLTKTTHFKRKHFSMAGLLRFGFFLWLVVIGIMFPP